MKRSEMLKKIFEYVVYECGDYDDPAHKINSEIHAEAILKLIEKAGIKPPYYNPFDRSLGEAETQIKYYKWEPEDEKK